MRKARIAVLVSGGGTNLQALIDAQKEGILKSGEIKLVISNRSDAYAIERAKTANIRTAVIMKKSFTSKDVWEDKLIETIDAEEIDFIILAGFMSILTEKFTKHFDHRIINIHPALIPSFCGEGMYGLKVHEAALAKGVKVTGATVHYVNEIPDGGEIILQRAVNVRLGDTPEVLQQRVMRQAEWIILPKAAEMISKEIIK